MKICQMAKKDSIETAKALASAQWKADISELTKERHESLQKVMDAMPGGKIRSQILYLENNILPAVKAKRGGEGSADYVFFKSLIDSLKWALVMYDRNDRLMRESSLLRLRSVIMEQQLELSERELQKYTSLEDLYLSECLDHIDRGVRAKIEREVNGKK